MVLGGRRRRNGCAISSASSFSETLAARRPAAIAVKGLPPVSQRRHQRIHHHVARPGIERDHVVQLCPRRQKRQVADAADVLHDARPPVVGEQRPIRIRHQRRALPSRRHVAHAEIRHGRDARPLRDDRRLADLQGRRRPRIRQMMDRLPVRADGRNVLRLAFGPADRRQGRAGKVLAQSEIQLANLGHRPVQAHMQDALPHHRRERLMHVRQDTGAQSASAPRNLRHHRINAVRRSPGHQPDDELGGVF